MLFHVQLTHSADNCWMHEGNDGKVNEFTERVKNAGEFGVTIKSAAVAPNEHSFFFLVEAESFEGVTGFFGPPVLQDHDADIVPVMSIANPADIENAAETLQVE